MERILNFEVNHNGSRKDYKLILTLYCCVHELINNYKFINSLIAWGLQTKSAYIQVANTFDATQHQIPSGFHTNGVYNLGEVNEIHSSMKNWFVQFQGVSTKHLSRYLAWFRFKKLLDYHEMMNKHNRITMNYSIKETIRFLINAIHSTPFPVDITKPYL